MKINEAAQLASISTVYFLKNSLFYHDDNNNTNITDNDDDNDDVDINNVNDIVINLTVDILMKEDDDSSYCYSSCSSSSNNSDDEYYNDDKIYKILNKFSCLSTHNDNNISTINNNKNEQKFSCTSISSSLNCHCNDIVEDSTTYNYDDDNFLWNCFTCNDDYIEIIHKDDNDDDTDDITYRSNDSISSSSKDYNRNGTNQRKGNYNMLANIRKVLDIW